MSGYDAPAPDIALAHVPAGRRPAEPRPRRPVPGRRWPGLCCWSARRSPRSGPCSRGRRFPTRSPCQGIPRTFNGFTDIAGESRDGPFFVAFAAILAAFGITLLLAKRVTAVLILGAILAGFGAAAAVIDLLDVADPDGVPAALQPSVGVGLPIVVGGFVLALAGSLVGLLSGRSRGLGVGVIVIRLVHKSHFCPRRQYPCLTALSAVVQHAAEWGRHPES